MSYQTVKGHEKNLKCILLSESNQFEKTVYYMSLTRWHSKRENGRGDSRDQRFEEVGERLEWNRSLWRENDGQALGRHWRCCRALPQTGIVDGCHRKRNWWCRVASENKRGCKSETALKEKWSTNEGAVAVIDRFQSRG